jgi:hypothetical protein
MFQASARMTPSSTGTIADASPVLPRLPGSRGVLVPRCTGLPLRTESEATSVPEARGCRSTRTRPSRPGASDITKSNQECTHRSCRPRVRRDEIEGRPVPKKQRGPVWPQDTPRLTITDKSGRQTQIMKGPRDPGNTAFA